MSDNLHVATRKGLFAQSVVHALFHRRNGDRRRRGLVLRLSRMPAAAGQERKGGCGCNRDPEAINVVVNHVAHLPV